MDSRRGFWKFWRPKTGPDSAPKDQGEPVETGQSGGSPYARRVAAQEISVQVGLDFGTSGTKAAYRRIGGNGDVHAVDFGTSTVEYPKYVLPSLVCHGEGEFLFGHEAADVLRDRPHDHGFRNFKVVLAGKHDEHHRDQKSVALFDREAGRLAGVERGLAEEYICSLYLAYAMRTVRERLAKIDELTGAVLNVLFNVCIPIDHIENNQLWPVFKRVLACAELCEREWNRLAGVRYDFEQWRSYWQDADYAQSGPQSYERAGGAARVFAIPESVAQVAPFSTSSAAERGLYAMIDFGAGTTDISIFKINDNDTMHFFASRNMPVGGRGLEDELVTKAFCRQVTRREIIGLLRELAPLPERHRRAKHPAAARCIDQHYAAIYAGTSPEWGAATSRLRNADFWRRVTLFTAGGASGFDVIREKFSVPIPYGLGSPRQKVRYSVETIGKPRNYRSDDWAPYGRLAVAYGLTYPGPTLQGITLPSDAPDHTPPIIRLNVPDRDETI